MSTHLYQDAKSRYSRSGNSNGGSHSNLGSSGGGGGSRKGSPPVVDYDRVPTVLSSSTLPLQPLRNNLNQHSSATTRQGKYPQLAPPAGAVSSRYQQHPQQQQAPRNAQAQQLLEKNHTSGSRSNSSPSTSSGFPAGIAAVHPPPKLFSSGGSRHQSGDSSGTGGSKPPFVAGSRSTRSTSSPVLDGSSYSSPMRDKKQAGHTLTAGSGNSPPHQGGSRSSSVGGRSPVSTEDNGSSSSSRYRRVHSATSPEELRREQMRHAAKLGHPTEQYSQPPPPQQHQSKPHRQPSPRGAWNQGPGGSGGPTKARGGGNSTKTTGGNFTRSHSAQGPPAPSATTTHNKKRDAFTLWSPSRRRQVYLRNEEDDEDEDEASYYHGYDHAQQQQQQGYGTASFDRSGFSHHHQSHPHPHQHSNNQNSTSPPLQSILTTTTRSASSSSPVPQQSLTTQQHQQQHQQNERDREKSLRVESLKREFLSFLEEDQADEHRRSMSLDGVGGAHQEAEDQIGTLRAPSAAEWSACRVSASVVVSSPSREQHEVYQEGGEHETTTTGFMGRYSYYTVCGEEDEPDALGSGGPQEDRTPQGSRLVVTTRSRSVSSQTDQQQRKELNFSSPGAAAGQIQQNGCSLNLDAPQSSSSVSMQRSSISETMEELLNRAESSYQAEVLEEQTSTRREEEKEEEEAGCGLHHNNTQQVAAAPTSRQVSVGSAYSPHHACPYAPSAPHTPGENATAQPSGEEGCISPWTSPPRLGVVQKGDIVPGVTDDSHGVSGGVGISCLRGAAQGQAQSQAFPPLPKSPRIASSTTPTFAAALPLRFAESGTMTVEPVAPQVVTEDRSCSPIPQPEEEEGAEEELEVAEIEKKENAEVQCRLLQDPPIVTRKNISLQTEPELPLVPWSMRRHRQDRDESQGRLAVQELEESVWQSSIVQPLRIATLERCVDLLSGRSSSETSPEDHQKRRSPSQTNSPGATSRDDLLLLIEQLIDDNAVLTQRLQDTHPLRRF